MSNYLPQPPRVWSRVQNQCTYTVDSSYNNIYIPLINKTLPSVEALYLDKQLYKGNILQYKGNSSRLTKNQKYAQLSKGLWCNRTKVFATQSQTYSNPNTTSFKRVNSVNIPFPNQVPGFPNNISGPFQYNVPNPYNCPTNVVQDGGNLVCNTYVNPCTGQVIQRVKEQQCYPTYCSDVPGQIMDLCWNPKLQTWFPRNNLTNNNSNSKWPVNYKGLVSAVTPDAPVLLTVIGDCGSVELTWSYVLNACIPISSFNIYQDGILVKTVPYTITSTTLNNLNYDTTYSFYIISLSNTTPSDPSNTLSTTTKELNIPYININSYNPEIPSINFILAPGSNQTDGTLGCTTSQYSYNLYTVIGSTYSITNISGTTDNNPQSYTSVPLLYNTEYSFYLKYISNNDNESLLSLPVVVSTIIEPPTNLQATPGCGFVNLTWTNPSTTIFVLGYNIYNNSGFLVGTTDVLSNSYQVTGLNYNTFYSFYITSYNNGTNSMPSAPANTTTYSLNIPNVTYNTTTYPNVTFTLTDGIGCTTTSYSYNLYYSAGRGNSSITNISNPYTFNLSYNLIYDFNFTYVASNGNESAKSNTVSINTVLYPPTSVSAQVVSITSASVSWTNPSSSFVTGYSITNYVSSATSPQSITGLTSGNSYTFTVNALYGSSNMKSATSGSITLPYYLNITASGYNPTLSIFPSSTSSYGILVYDNTSPSGSITINSAYSGAVINTICIGGGGNGGTSAPANGGFNGAGGGGGGGYYSFKTFSATDTSYKNIYIAVGSGGQSGSDTVILYNYGLLPIPINSANNGGNGGNGGDKGGDGGSGSTNGGTGASQLVYPGPGNNSLTGPTITINDTTYYVYYGASGGGGGSIGGFGPGGLGGTTGGGNGGSYIGQRTGYGGTSSYSQSSNSFDLYYGNGGGGGAINPGLSGGGYSGGSGSSGLVILYWSS